MKTLVQFKDYPLQIASANTLSANFNLNNVDWTKLKNRINVETTPSLSSIFLLFPPGGTKRDYTIRYKLECASDIPGVPVGLIEDYWTNKITGRLNSSTDKLIGFPINTYNAAGYSFSPSNIYGTIIIDTDIAPYISQGSSKWNQDNAFYRISPSWKPPVVTNIAINQTDPRLPITVTWDATIQDDFDIEAWQDGIKKYSTSGGIQKNAIIPAKALGLGAFDIKVVSANNPIDDLGITGTTTKSFTTTSINPTAQNLKANQLEARLPIMLSWESTNQTDFKANIIQDGVLKRAITGITNDASIPPNTVTDGMFTVDLHVNNTINGISSTVILTNNFTALIDKPLITSLEPDNINNNVNLPILCTWNALKQEIYTLKLIQDNKVLKTYNGTTAQQLNIPADTFESGNCKLELTASNTVNGIIATSTKVSEFLGYGRPKIPIFNAQNIFNQALPIFKWTAEDQIAYKFSVWKQSELIEQSGEVISTLSEFHTIVSLENNTEYAIKVQTKNQFGLWSYVSEKNITTSYTELTKPEFDLIPDSEGGILVNLDILEENSFSGAEIWRKEEYEDKFKRLAINLGFKGQWADYTIAANKTYYYKVVSKTLDGGRTESDIKSAKSIVRNFHFVNIEDVSKKLILKRNPKVTVTNINDVALFMFAGRQAPAIQKGITNYKSFEMSFELDQEEFSMLEHINSIANVILYRDGRGRKAYGAITSSIKETPVPSNLKRTIVSFTFTETSFTEEDIYSATGGLILRKFDGTWKFDGTVKFNGIVGWDYGV